MWPSRHESLLWHICRINLALNLIMAWLNPLCSYLLPQQHNPAMGYKHVKLLRLLRLVWGTLRMGVLQDTAQVGDIRYPTTVSPWSGLLRVCHSPRRVLHWPEGAGLVSQAPLAGNSCYWGKYKYLTLTIMNRPRLKVCSDHLDGRLGRVWRSGSSALTEHLGEYGITIFCTMHKFARRNRSNLICLIYWK